MGTNNTWWGGGWLWMVEITKLFYLFNSGGLLVRLRENIFIDY